MSDSNVQISESSDGSQTTVTEVGKQCAAQQTSQQTSQTTQQATQQTTQQTTQQSQQSPKSSVCVTSTDNQMETQSVAIIGAHMTPQNASTETSVVSTMPSLASPVVSSVMAAQSSSAQIMVSNSQQNQTINNALNTMSLNSANAQTVHIHQGVQSMPNIHSVQSVQSIQSPQHTSILQPTTGQMNVAVSQLPQQLQMIGATAAPTYQFQQLYPQQVQILPGNLTIQNMPFSAGNPGLSLQIPFSATNAVNSNAMPISSIASKPPIMSKGVAISPLTTIAAQGTHQMISPLKQGITSPQILKQVLPTQQFVPQSTNQTVVISQLLPQHNHHTLQPSILPATANRTVLDSSKGKPFGLGSVRSSFGNKMLSNSGAIHPKSSPILPASTLSSPLTHFKSPFQTAGNATQLITAQATPTGLIANQPQILSSFQTIPQGLTWTTAPQSAHLVAQNGSPIFIRTPSQTGEHMFIQTSTPQIQTVSMAPINVGSSGNTFQVSHTPSSSHNTTPVAQPLQQTISMMTPSVATATSTVASLAHTSPHTTTHPAPIAPAPPNTSKPRVIRPASCSISTQTMAPQKQHVESTTPAKPVSNAKPKSTQAVATSKTSNKEHNTSSTPTSTRSVSVGVATNTQTQTQNNKSDASNQTKVSVATETNKPTNAVSSNRAESNKSANKISSSTTASVVSTTTTATTITTTTTTASVANSHNTTVSTTASNTSHDKTQSKANSTDEAKPIKKSVEKKDASTDIDLMSNYSHHQQSNSNIQSTTPISTSTQMSTNSVQQNGQIAVLSDLNRQDISKQPQKAIVKPQILTHVIDGYIVQESPIPFPVNGLSYSPERPLMDNLNNGIISSDAVKSSKNKNENILNASSSRSRSTDAQSCLNCGNKRKNSKNSKKSKRFCSSSCAEKFKNNIHEKNEVLNRLGLYNAINHNESNAALHQRTNVATVESQQMDSEKNSHDERKRVKTAKKSTDNNEWNSTKNGEMSAMNNNSRKSIPAQHLQNSIENTNSTATNNLETKVEDTSSSVAGLYIPSGGKNPLKWSVQDVYEFVRNLQGCTEYADEFRSQEIDGQALMLLKEDHLMSAMNMKLGPALKICNKINALREDVQKQS